MSIAAHRRRLDRVKKPAPTWLEEWNQAVYAAGREYAAALDLIAFARALAGTDRIRARALAASPRDEAAVPAARAEQAPPVERAGRWSRTNRPGPRDVITWDELMQLTAWRQEDDEAERQAEAEAQARAMAASGPMPWYGPNGILPSYARRPQEPPEDGNGDGKG